MLAQIATETDGLTLNQPLEKVFFAQPGFNFQCIETHCLARYWNMFSPEKNSLYVLSVREKSRLFSSISINRTL